MSETPGTRFCPTCGGAVAPGEQFCRLCGASLDAGPGAAAVAPRTGPLGPAATPSYQQPPPAAQPPYHYQPAFQPPAGDAGVSGSAPYAAFPSAAPSSDGAGAPPSRAPGNAPGYDAAPTEAAAYAASAGPPSDQPPSYGQAPYAMPPQQAYGAPSSPPGAPPPPPYGVPPSAGYGAPSPPPYGGSGTPYGSPPGGGYGAAYGPAPYGSGNLPPPLWQAQPPAGGYGGQGMPYPGGAYAGQGYGIGVQYAGFWTRFLASLIDGIVLNIPTQFLLRVLPQPVVSQRGLGGSTNFSVDWGAFWLQIAVSMLIAATYYVVAYSRYGRTLGKLALGLRVVDAQGRNLTPVKAFVRYISTNLSAMILFIGYIMVAWDSRKQALHDKIAGSFVIRTG